MSKLKFKISRYNESGFPSFLPRAEDGINLDRDTTSKWLGTDMYGKDILNPNYKKPERPGISSAGKSAFMAASSAFSNAIQQPVNQDYLAKSPDFAKAVSHRKDIEKGVDAASSAAAVIPGPGWIIAGGLQIGKGLGKTTQDQYGVYKNKTLESRDNVFNPVKGYQNLEDLINHPSWDTFSNIATAGIFGKSWSNEEAKKRKEKYINEGIASQTGAANITGAQSRAAIGGFEAAPYGKKGRKLKRSTKYSQCYQQPTGLPTSQGGLFQ